MQGVYQFRPALARRAHATTRSIPARRDIGLVDPTACSRPRDFALLGSRGSRARTSLMLEWNPSEFSRLRAQFAWDDARDASTDEQFFLQYIYSLGVHGAHKF